MAAKTADLMAANSVSSLVVWMVVLRAEMMVALMAWSSVGSLVEGRAV